MSDSQDFKTLTVTELRKACSDRNLETSGRKVVLIERLEEYQVSLLLDVDMKEENKDAEENIEGKEVKGSNEEIEVEELKEEVQKQNKVKDTKTVQPMLMKGAFNLYYNVNHLLKMVIINPFQEICMQSPSLQSWCEKAKHFDIRKAGNGSLEAVLYFNTVSMGDEAFHDLKSSLSCHEVSVLHPAPVTEQSTSLPVTVVAGNYWDQLEQYSKVAKSPCQLWESKKESIFKRHVVLENVLDSVTEDDVLEKFPEAKSVIIFPFSDYRSLRMLEFKDETEANTFLKKYKFQSKDVELHDAKINIAKYSVRVAEWAKQRIKLDSDEPCSFTDEERVEICKQLAASEIQKSLTWNRSDLLGEEKIERYMTLHEKMKPMIEALKQDTNRRRKEGSSFPEPDEVKNSYTKFAETADFEDPKKNRNYYKYLDQNESKDRKRQSTGGGSGEPGNKKQFVPTRNVPPRNVPTRNFPPSRNVPTRNVPTGNVLNQRSFAGSSQYNTQNMMGQGRIGYRGFHDGVGRSQDELVDMVQGLSQAISSIQSQMRRGGFQRHLPSEQFQGRWQKGGRF